MGLVDIGGGLKMFVPDEKAAGGGEFGGSGLENISKILGLAKMAGEVKRGPQEAKKLQLEIDRAQQEKGKAAGEAVKDAFLNTPAIIQSQGLRAGDAYLRERIPGANLAPGPGGKGVVLSLPDKTSYLVDPNKQLSGKDLITTSMQFRQDFERSTRPLQESFLAFDSIEKLANREEAKIAKGEPINPLAGVATAYLFIRGLSPGIVNEGEYRIATQGSRPLTEMAEAIISKWKTGSPIDSNQIRRFWELARERKGDVQNQLTPIIANSEQTSLRWGLDPRDIVAPVGVSLDNPHLFQIPEDVRAYVAQNASALKAKGAGAPRKPGIQAGAPVGGESMAPAMPPGMTLDQMLQEKFRHLQGGQ